MSDADLDSNLEAQIEAANGYETLMVPALFGQWPPMVADAAGIQGGDRVLDIACGTGVLSRELESRTGPTGFVAGLDPNAGMLRVAHRLAPTIEWRQGSAESLPFPDECFDAVVSQFGLMFFNDRRAALREALRVLVPDGCMAMAVWDSLETMPAYAAEVALLERAAGRAAADALRAPFALGDRRELTALFTDAGVESVDVATHQGTARFPSVQAMVEADLRGWLPLMNVFLPEESIAEILQEAERVLEAYVMPDGSVSFSLSAHIATGFH
jgi:ubiquinone/menaquinone biosynthesis C-methylase UbiE